MEREIRAFKLTELRIDAQGDKPPCIYGYSAVFDQLSEDLGGFREKIAQGAFTKTIQTADVRALFNHDPNYVLGRCKSGTLSLEEDSVGLRIENTPPDTQWARDLLVTMRRGDVDQMSFAFETVRDSWEQDKTTGTVTRTLLECNLMDVSPVTFPAYPKTSAAVRSKLSEFQQPTPAGQAAPPVPDIADAQIRIRGMRRQLELADRSIV